MLSTPIKCSNRIEWRNEQDELHRVDGPAIEFLNGGKQWYVHAYAFTLPR